MTISLRIFYYTAHDNSEQFMTIIKRLHQLEEFVLSDSKQLVKDLPHLQKALPTCVVSLSSQVFYL